MPKIRELLIVPHTHHDIGYTHVPEVCLQMQERSIYEIIELCELGTDDAPESFRWTVEITRPFIDFLTHANLEWIERLHELVRRGRVAITAAYAHMTQLIGHEEYIRSFYPLREIRWKHQFPVSILQHGDINGLSWGIVPLMNALELDTLVMALNPDHGYAPLEQPSAFYWEGQDGSRVFVWLSMFYSIANNPWELTAGRIDKAIEPVRAMVERLEARSDYPFDFALIHSAEDNMLPNNKISEAVRRWNDAGHQPPMRIVTIDEAMQKAKAQAKNLPVLRGEWADWWAHGHSSSAYEVGLSRLARAEMRVAEMTRVWANLSEKSAAKIELYDLPIANWYRVSNLPLSRFDWQSRIDLLQDDLLLFAEHTWGTFETVSQPYSHFTRSHWQMKANFVYRALAESHNLSRENLTELAASLPAAEDLALIVVNPLSVQRDELVSVRTPGIDHTVLVRDIPPMGVKVVKWDAAYYDERIEIEAKTTIENDDYCLTLDPDSASIISLIDKETGKEWLDKEAITGLGTVIYESPDEPEHPAVKLQRNHFHPKTPGPKFAYTPAEGTGSLKIKRLHYGLVITMQAKHEFMPFIETEIILHKHFKAIDIRITMDKLENYAMEGVYVAFPFALNPASFWIESANTVYQADAEQIPASCHDWYSIQHGMAISDNESTLLWASREAPLVQLGAFNTGKWQKSLPQTRGHFYSWLMNNLYFTNFKAAQGGRMQFNYRFTTKNAAPTIDEVRAFGEAFANPPMGRIAPLQESSHEWLRIEPETVQVQAFKPAINDESAFILRLKETAGQATKVKILWKHPQAVRLFQSDLLETETGQALIEEDGAFILELGAHELTSLKGISA